LGQEADMERQQEIEIMVEDRKEEEKAGVDIFVC
jgi:hypothetical protein